MMPSHQIRLSRALRVAWNMASFITSTQLSRLLDYIGGFNIWKVLAIVFALLNLKSLPLFWHFRLLNGFLRHFILFPPRLTHKNGPSALFQPMMISSRTNILECDYNLHKSNSTYFLDFDVARMHLLICLIGPGMKNTGKELGAGIDIVLGGVSCNFRREIKPYQAFEVWSRILCWDRKWLYAISHFVPKGSVKPKTYTLQPWRKMQVDEKKKGKEGQVAGEKAIANGEVAAPAPYPIIFASAISKYVFKRGRLTISPEKILRNSNLLPPRPRSADSPPPPTASPAVEANSFEASAATMLPTLSQSQIAEEKIIDAALGTKPDSKRDEVWDWDRIESERLRGMRVAEMYAGLEALNEEFTYEDRPVLGEYRDLF